MISQKPGRIKALVFDFDGLILETEGPIYQSWLELYQSYNLDIAMEKWVLNIGTAEETFDPLAELEALSGQSVSPTRLENRWQREMELVMTQSTLPGVRDYLEDARQLGLKIALASSSSCNWVESHLERLRLIGYFDCIQASDDVPITKPDPALYLTAVQRLEAQPFEAIAFEDSVNGILSAKQAGLYCVVVPNEMTRRLDTSLADIRLNSLADLPLSELIDRIELLAIRR